MCETCPNLLCCQPTHCQGYAKGRPSIADIYATGERQRNRDVHAVENLSTVRTSDSRSILQVA